MALSTRAQAADKCTDANLMWKVIRNLWDPESNPDGIVSLGVAENSLMHDVLAKHIHDNLALTNPAFTYGDSITGSDRLKGALARFLTRHLKPVKTIEPSHISVANGCSATIEHLSWALANPGEGFLLGQPFYGTFVPDITYRPASKVIPVPFHGVDPLGDESVAKYEEALIAATKKGIKMAGLILCNPHNPLGRCYSRGVIIKLMKLCQKHDMHFISDEIYALSVWDNTVDDGPETVSFQSALSIDTTEIIDPRLVHVVWGMSKDFGANGIRSGAIISQHQPRLHNALISVGLYSSVSSMTEHATANILEDDAWVESYIAQNRFKLSQQYKCVTSWAKKNSIAYAPGVNAAFFLWVDLGSAYRKRHPDKDLRDINSIITQLLLDNRIFLASGTDFGAEEEGWFRIVFSHLDYYLNEGLRRVVEALKM